jgi:hypothetical protein
MSPLPDASMGARRRGAVEAFVTPTLARVIGKVALCLDRAAKVI